MLSFLFNVLKGLFGILNSFLPDDPFTPYIRSFDAWDTALGWLNWVIPVNTCLVIAGLWLTALVAFTVISYALDVVFELKPEG